MGSDIDIAYVADLARLELDAAAMARLGRETGAVLEYVDLLREVDIDGIEPTAHAAVLTNVWRDDVAAESFPRESMLANAPAEIDDELIKVPQVLPGEGMS